MKILNHCPGCGKFWNKTEYGFQACESCNFRASLQPQTEPVTKPVHSLETIATVLRQSCYKAADGSALEETSVFRSLEAWAKKPPTTVNINIEKLVENISLYTVDGGSDAAKLIGRQLAESLKGFADCSISGL